MKFQSDLIKSTEDQGGYARKINGGLQHGVADLVMVMPHFAPAFIECKDLGVVPDNFKRKVETTALQRDFMENLCAVSNRRVAFVMLHAVYRGEHVAISVSWCTEEVNQRHITACLEFCSFRKSLRYPELARIFSRMGVPYVN